MANEGDEALWRYVRMLAKEWLAADPSRTAKELAAKVGVSGAHFSAILGENVTGVGLKTIRGMERLLGKQPGAIISEAGPWAAAGGMPKQKARVVDRADDQEFRPEAIAMLEKMGVKPGAINRLRALPGSYSQEPRPLAFWVKLGLTFNEIPDDEPRAGVARDSEDDRSPAEIQDEADRAQNAKPPTPPKKKTPPKNPRKPKTT